MAETSAYGASPRAEGDPEQNPGARDRQSECDENKQTKKRKGEHGCRRTLSRTTAETNVHFVAAEMGPATAATASSSQRVSATAGETGRSSDDVVAGNGLADFASSLAHSFLPEKERSDSLSARLNRRTRRVLARHSLFFSMLRERSCRGSASTMGGA